MYKVLISAEELARDCELLGERIRGSGETYDCILAITRGGLVPAYYLARELGIRDIRTVGVESYNGQKKIEHKIHNKPENLPENVLLVDDLVDTGGTVSFLLKTITFKSVHIAVPYKKQHSTLEPTYCVKEYDSNVWLDFFYEIKEAHLLPE